MFVDAISNIVRSIHGMALLMAAIMHDDRHTGVTNGNLVRDLDPLAVTYNDAPALEIFPAAEGFKMMLDPRFDLFKASTKTRQRTMRLNVCSCASCLLLLRWCEFIPCAMPTGSDRWRHTFNGMIFLTEAYPWVTCRIHTYLVDVVRFRFIQHIILCSGIRAIFRRAPTTIAIIVSRRVVAVEMQQCDEAKMKMSVQRKTCSIPRHCYRHRRLFPGHVGRTAGGSQRSPTPKFHFRQAMCISA